MSNNSEVLKKLARWAAVNVVVGGILFALAGGWRLVTFDRDFRRFAGLDLLLLEL